MTTADTGAGQPESSTGTENPDATAESKNTDTAAQPKKSTEKKFDPVTAAYSDGLKDGERRILKKLKAESLDEVEEALAARNEAQAKLQELQETVEKPENLPAVQALQKKLEKLEADLAAREARLREVEIGTRIEAVASKGALPPKVMRLLFEQEYDVGLNADGQVEVRDRSTNMPLRNESGLMPLSDVYEQWLDRHPEYKAASPNTGSGSEGGEGRDKKTEPSWEKLQQEAQKLYGS